MFSTTVEFTKTGLEKLNHTIYEEAMLSGMDEIGFEILETVQEECPACTENLRESHKVRETKDEEGNGIGVEVYVGENAMKNKQGKASEYWHDVVDNGGSGQKYPNEFTGEECIASTGPNDYPTRAAETLFGGQINNEILSIINKSIGEAFE